MPKIDLLYIGEATKNKLWSKGERTIGDLVNIGPQRLAEWFGKVGWEHYIRATGQDTTPLAAMDGSPVIKSIGNGSTTPYDMQKEEEVHNMAHVLASSVCERMRAHKLEARTVEVGITYAEDGAMRYISYQAPLPIPTNLDREFAPAALDLFFKRYRQKHPIRKLNVRGKDLCYADSVYQTSLEYNVLTREKAMKLAACKDEINERWRRAVVRCVELADPMLTGLGTKPNQQFAPAGWY